MGHVSDMKWKSVPRNVFFSIGTCRRFTSQVQTIAETNTNVNDSVIILLLSTTSPLSTTNTAVQAVQHSDTIILEAVNPKWQATEQIGFF